MTSGGSGNRYKHRPLYLSERLMLGIRGMAIASAISGPLNNHSTLFVMNKFIWAVMYPHIRAES